MEEDRRSREAVAAMHDLLDRLSAAACTGQWRGARAAAQALQELFGELEATGHPGFDPFLMPNPSLETLLADMLEALGYPAARVAQLRCALATPGEDPHAGDREVLRAELQAYAARAEGRNALILASLDGGISEAEASRLSGLARNTVRAVRSGALPDTSTEESAPDWQPQTPWVPAAPPVTFVAPVPRPGPELLG
ncbi:hypothetical protein [Streptomyces alboflavus]|nr:hypothetical protein [Streptomyces alboflavus]